MWIGGGLILGGVYIWVDGGQMLLNLSLQRLHSCQRGLNTGRRRLDQGTSRRWLQFCPAAAKSETSCHAYKTSPCPLETFQQ